MRKLYAEATVAYIKKDFKRSDSLGNTLFNLAEIADDDKFRILGLIGMSYSRSESANRNERFKYLYKAESLLGRINNDSVTADLYNFMGICAYGDFELAKDYFYKSLRAARNIGSTSLEMRAECNLAEIYRHSGDTLGIRYDKDIYELKKKTGNEVLRHAAAVRCAEYYMKARSTLQQAYTFISEIKGMEGQDFYYHYLRSKWLLANDSLFKSMEEWNRAYDTGVATPGFLLAGGRLRQMHGDFRESERLLMSADSGFLTVDPLNIERIDIFRLRAKNLQKLGRTQEALSMMEKYAIARDSIRESKNKRDINSFKVKFETEKKELLISKQKGELRMRAILLCLVVFILIASTCGFIIYIRNRNRLFRLIVEQQKEFTTRQNKYAPYLDKNQEIKEGKYEEYDKDSQNYTNYIKDKSSGNGLPSQKKADAIWRAILLAMETNRIYTDPNVTRDSFAERIGTNHTWLTAIIKDHTGKSYTQFINSWRINEAVKILSEENCGYTNKELSELLGFMTPQSFYNTFRQQMGMSPARFRQDILSVSTADKTED